MFLPNRSKLIAGIAFATFLSSFGCLAAPELADIIDCFAGKNTKYPLRPFFGLVRLIEVREQGDVYNYYGVHVNDQQYIDFAQFKYKISTRMGFLGKPIIQIVGDSNRFSPAGTAFCRKFVREHLANDSIIEYGYTGYKTGGQELDTNSFVNEYIDEQPIQSRRILANVVGHTLFAINKWGCYVSPHVHHFVVVYNDSGMATEPQFDENGKKTAGFTTFGDDVTMSDFACDRLICLEGGAQSFLQAVNVLQQGNSIEAVYNIRKPSDAKMFSAARFLQKVDAAFIAGKVPSKEIVRIIFTNYIKTLNSMFNESKPDFKTKKALFDKAINAFIDGNLFERVHDHCRFYDAK